MNWKLRIALLLLVLAPLVLLGWIGRRTVAREREAVREQIEALHRSRLETVRDRVTGILDEHRRALWAVTDDLPGGSAAPRELIRRHGLIRQLFVLGPDGRLLHPPLEGELSRTESAFLTRTRPIWTDPRSFGEGAPGKAVHQQASRPSSRESAEVIPEEGWRVWYWEHGLDLIYWRRLPDARVVGVELDRIWLLADLAGRLPATEPERPGAPTERIELRDARGRTVYQWGGYEPGEGAPALLLPLEDPLSTWSLAFHVPATALSVGQGATLGLAVGLAALALALVGLALYLYREHDRQMREAAQRVGFVGRVSHELRTPLTNIRLYAELLEDELAGEEGPALRHLEVIAGESRRLSRLIANVLTFGRREREPARLHRRPGSVDRQVAAVLEAFRPSLDERQVEVRFRPGAPETVLLDADLLDQVLGNLLSNVEKYAPSAPVEIETLREGTATVITLQDGGPGIPPREAERIFQPFQRLTDRIDEGVSGAGIGLTIARELARRHGGELTVEPSEQGARFRLTLETPPAEAEEETP